METREELIRLCEDASRCERVWYNRDSASAQRQVGEAWALLRAGCEFELDALTDEKTIWINITYKGFNYFEEGLANQDIFYIPSRQSLEGSVDRDWY